jgi:adenosine/AMP kinase
LAAADYPWLPSVYEGTSRFIHFSPQHVVQTIRSVDEPNRTVTTVICQGAPNCPESSIEELLDATAEATRSVLNVVDGWIIWKVENEKLLGPEFDARMERGGS